MAEKIGAMNDADRAKQIIDYFLKYNYKIKSADNVIIFGGQYQARVGQSLSVFSYTLVGIDNNAIYPFSIFTIITFLSIRKCK